MVTIIFRHFLIWCRVHNWIKDYKLPCLSGCISLKAILGLHKLYLLFLCTNNFLEKHICKLDILLWGRIYRGGKSWAGCLSDISSICRRSLLWWAKHSRLCPPQGICIWNTIEPFYLTVSNWFTWLYSLHYNFSDSFGKITLHHFICSQN